MGFLFAVLGFVVAEEVVELEPVKALSFGCGVYNGTADGKGQVPCQLSPFCYWNGSGNACLDDPCLLKNNRILANDADPCENADSVNCEAKTYSVLGNDCSSTTPNTGKVCVNKVQDGAPARQLLDYCAYAYIRDQKCPDSICVVQSGSGAQPGCIPYNSSGCQQLASETDCGLVPKCWYNSSAKTCQRDPCFVGSLDINCATFNKTFAADDVDFPNLVLAPGDCVDFKPLKRGTTNIYSRCLYKNNKEPNICYFAGKSDDTDVSTTDNGVSYPTMDLTSVNPSKTPTCAGTITGCEGTGECYSTLNTQGALAGLYCTDGSHGNAANILRIPSVLVFLVVSVLSMLLL